jgi:hypothetical protein
LGALHGTPAGRTKRWVKKICCVTTRRCNLVALGGLWRRWDALTARTFGLGMLGFDGIVLASPRLPPRRLPAPHQTQAFSILAVTLVPTPRLILAPTRNKKGSGLITRRCLWRLLRSTASAEGRLQA